MSLKEKINQNFIVAFKNKNMFLKDTLGSLKAKITEAEKKNKNTELKDEEIYGVLSSMIKQREQAIEIYSKNDSEQAKINAQKEIDEIFILKEYLPMQLSDEEIKKIINENVISVQSDPKRVMGDIMKYFNTNYKGQFDNKRLTSVINESFGCSK